MPVLVSSLSSLFLCLCVFSISLSLWLSVSLSLFLSLFFSCERVACRFCVISFNDKFTELALKCKKNFCTFAAGKVRLGWSKKMLPIYFCFGGHLDLNMLILGRFEHRYVRIVNARSKKLEICKVCSC